MTSSLGPIADYDELYGPESEVSNDAKPQHEAERWPTEPPPEEDGYRCDKSDRSDQSSEPIDLSSHLSLTAHPTTVPPTLEDAALHGIAGELVRRIDPHTEADPAAVLITTLVLFGNLIGPSPFLSVGATRHHCNLFALVVGSTSKARKGTSVAEAMRAARMVDERWADECVTSGIASGEAVIALVAESGDDDEPRRVDRRALIIEEEFARLLSTARREGSTVSPIIRSAWDSRPLRITTKANSLTATGHHISVLGHITADELHSVGRSLDIANGLHNRFLFAYAQRSKLLPSGGSLRDGDLADLVGRAHAAVQTARTCGELRRTRAAELRWAELYEACADDDPGGLFGAVTARAEPQLLRLSLVYALLDAAPAVDVPHLDAAWALWRYCRASAGYLFGDALGDPIADRIDAALREHPAGLDRTALRDLFGRHVRSGQLDTALELLTEHQRLTAYRENTAGRPRTVYRHTSATKEHK